MSWEQHLLDDVSTSDLPAAIDHLFAVQFESWPRLRSGLEGLAQAETKRLPIRYFEIEARQIPYRIVSTTAKVDEASLRKRPCFLCAGNLPAEEKGIVLGRDLVILCNPLPILDRMCPSSTGATYPSRLSTIGMRSLVSPGTCPATLWSTTARNVAHPCPIISIFRRVAGMRFRSLGT